MIVSAIVELSNFPAPWVSFERLTPVDVECLSRGKGGPVRVEDPVEAVADFAELAKRVTVCHTRQGGGGVARPDHPQTDGRHSNPV